MNVNQAAESAARHGLPLLERYKHTRQVTADLCSALEPEDYIIQSGPDVSPPKWHLAHTTWFFETFILKRHAKGYMDFNPAFAYLYNSYYEAVGPFYPRPKRGLVARPSHEVIMEYRNHVDNNLVDFYSQSLDGESRQLDFLIELGINHEQQHQELLMMDIKQNFSFNPLYFPYSEPVEYERNSPDEMKWMGIGEGIVEIGHSTPSFSFDNETPVHRQYLRGFEIADRPSTNGEYLEFINDGGYSRPEFWLSDGWSCTKHNGWESPEYWVMKDGKWHEFTMNGLSALDPDAPVSHVSFYEADAFARWKGCRLPTEFEWEAAAGKYGQSEPGNFLESGIYSTSSSYRGEMKKMFGDVWEWTASAYLPYPGYRPLEGALGEYNGKFMSGQMVLRGGSCLTPAEHIRSTYRNFFGPDKRWPVTGIRLARDVA